MNVKKAGLITTGVVAALVAASPLAWAVGPSETAPNPCSFTAQGEDAGEKNNITPDNTEPANAVAQAPFGGDNIGHYGECSTYNNNNGEGNGLGNTLNDVPLELPGTVGTQQ